jgi:flagellar hook-associated protein 2
MATSSTIFNGTSRYSTDFQSVVDRTVAIASLSLTALNNDKSKLAAQSAALSSVGSVLSGLQTAVNNLSSAATTGSLQTSVSDGSILSAVASAGGFDGAYTVEVTSLGSYTNALTKDGLTRVTDPTTQNVSNAASFTLTIDGEPTTITPAAANLNSLVLAINAQSSTLNVQASIVNVGNSDSPDYRLSLQSTKLGPKVITLDGGSGDILNTLATGDLASYKVNGLATESTSDTRSITLAPNLTVTLFKESAAGVATSIIVSHTASGVSNALSGLANAYNNAAAELDKHRGSGGALAGNSLISTLSGALRDLIGYSSGSSDLNSLTALGLSFDDKGKLSFDSTAFAANTSGCIDDVLSLVGGSSSGFVQSATSLLDGLGGTDGIIQSAIQSVTDQTTAQDKRIAEEQDRVDTVRTDTQARISAADALIASLEQQVLYVQGLFASFFTTQTR